MVFADEGTTDDPMRYTTAASLADYMQTEIRISAGVINSGTLLEARLPTDVANAYTGSSLSGNTITFSEVDGGSETLDLDLPASAITSGTIAAARLPAVSGTLTVGTAAVMNPMSDDFDQVTTAHGLSSRPTFVITYIECLVAISGYVVGDRVYFSGTDTGDNFNDDYGAASGASSTNVWVTKLAKEPRIPLAPGSDDLAQAEANNWILVAVPYLVN